METPKIAIIGLGYVGLPLAVEFGKHYEVVGFDINQTRVEELRKNQDVTLETTTEQLAEVNVPSIVELKDSGKGLDGVMEKAPDYWNPVEEFLKTRLAVAK